MFRVVVCVRACFCVVDCVVVVVGVCPRVSAVGFGVSAFVRGSHVCVACLCVMRGYGGVLRGRWCVVWLVGAPMIARSGLARCGALLVCVCGCLLCMCQVVRPRHRRRVLVVRGSSLVRLHVCLCAHCGCASACV